MTTRILAAALAVAMAVTLTARAEDKPAEPKKDKQKYRQLTGTIEAVDAASITVKGTETKTFKIDAKTIILVTGKETATAADLKKGEKAIVRYAAEGDAVVAKKITSPPPVKEKKEKEAKEAAPAAPAK